MNPVPYRAYIEQDKPINFQFAMEGAGCCIVVDTKILFLQRSSRQKIQPGTWGIPAGKLNVEETPEQAARRETLEEAGIDLSPESIEYQGHIYFSVGSECPLNYRFHVYTVHYAARPPVTLELDQVAYCWVTHEEALKLPVFTGTREVLELALRYTQQNPAGKL